MRISSIAAMGVAGATVSASLLLSPVRGQEPGTIAAARIPAPPATRLPATGRAAAPARMRHAVEIDEPEQPATVYALYVAPPPPPPPPVPPAAARPAAPRLATVYAPISMPASYFTIGVPIYRQAMPLDCETGALRMGLATYGHYYSDSALFAYENPDLRAPVMGANHTVVRWGDPYTNFVGNVFGSDTAPTGYGVYWPVIVAIAHSHGMPNAYGGEGFSPGTIYAALKAGHPVEVWVETYWGRPRLGTWTAWDGRQVRYSLIEHAVTLSGVSPTMVRVNDPLHGTQYWISKGTFQTVWRDFNDMAVIFE